MQSVNWKSVSGLIGEGVRTMAELSFMLAVAVFGLTFFFKAINLLGNY